MRNNVAEAHSEDRHEQRHGTVARLFRRDAGGADLAAQEDVTAAATDPNQPEDDSPQSAPARSMGPIEAKLERLKPARLRRAEEQLAEARVRRARLAEAHTAAVSAYQHDERKPDELRAAIDSTAQELSAAGELVQLARAALVAERERFQARFAQEAGKMVPGLVEAIRSFAQARASLAEVERFAQHNGLSVHAAIAHAGSQLHSATRLSRLADHLESETNG